MAAVWRMYGYQDYPAPDPPVCAFKVCTGDQLDDFKRRGDVTDLQIYYNQPEVLDCLKYTEFLVQYNTSLKLPRFYQDNRALKNNVSMDRHFFVVHIEGMEEFGYVYRPVREVKRCICIEMLYVSSFREITYRRRL